MMSVSVALLETEVLAMILEYAKPRDSLTFADQIVRLQVDDTSPESTKAASAVNRHWHVTSKLIVHRRKTIRFDDALPDEFRPDEIVDKWLSDPAVVAGLRHLEIASRRIVRGPPPVSHVRNYRCITRLISGLANLRTLIWSTGNPINGDLLNALHTHHPKAQLKLFSYQRLQPPTFDHTDKDEILLSHSPAVTTLRAEIWYAEGIEWPDLREAALRRIIANAPNLRTVTVIRGQYRNVVDFLEESEINDVAALCEKFYNHKKPSSSIRRLTLDGYGMSRRTLEEWGRFIDMSRLENLKCSRGMPDVSYFEAAPRVLPNLKHVSLNLAYNDKPDVVAAASTYLESCAPLETLSLWSWMKHISLEAILTKHGQTLRNLQLHERETISVDAPRGLLGAAGVRSIRDACPKLEELTFDMDRDNARLLEDAVESENANILRVLSTFGPQLEKVQIYFDLGILSIMGAAEEADDEPDEEDSGSSPLPSESPPPKRQKHRHVRKTVVPMTRHEHIKPYVGHMWRTMFGRKETTMASATRIFRPGAKELHVKFGEWERKMDTRYLAHWAMVEHTSRSWWIVTPGLRDDGADVGDQGCLIECIGGPAR